MTKWPSLLIAALCLPLWHGVAQAAETVEPRLQTVMVTPKARPVAGVPTPGHVGGDWQASAPDLSPATAAKLDAVRGSGGPDRTHWGIVGTGLGFVHRF